MIEVPRLGIALPMASHDQSAESFIHELTEETLAAERAGLSLVLVPEHHTGPPQSLTDPLSLVAWLLAKTSRIRIGTGVLLLPLHPAPRVAEQGAILQHASGGRLVLGIGAGYQPSDFDLFGIPKRERAKLLEANLLTLRAAWADELVNGLAVRPSLAGSSPPPLWLGAWSDAGLRRAARFADGWIADPIRSIGEVAGMAHRYREIGGKGPVVVMREAWVGPTDEEATAVYGPIVETIFRYYLRNGALPADGDLQEDDVRIHGPLGERVLVGSSQTVADRLAALAVETEADEIVLALRHPQGPAHRDVVAAIERIGTEVRPAMESRLADIGAR